MKKYSNNYIKNHALFLIFSIILLIPIITTIFLSSPTVNKINAYLLLLILLLPGSHLRVILTRAYGDYIYIIISFFILFVVAWQIQNGSTWLNGQLFLYISIAVTFPVLVYLFKVTGDRGLAHVFSIKSSAAIVISLIFILTIIKFTYSNNPHEDPFLNPPIYRNIRHFNYELFIIISLTFYFAHKEKNNCKRLLWLAIFVIYGYIMFWSAGRSMMLALFIYISLLATFPVIPGQSIKFGTFGLFVGAALVFITGQESQILHQSRKSIANLEELSSGRLTIWYDSIIFWANNPLSVIFGNGPDAFRLLLMKAVGAWVIQPHNLFIQILLEFGIVGLFFTLVCMLFISKKIIHTIRSRSSCALNKTISLTLFSTFFYAMLDGVFYHAISFVLIVFLTAFLFSSTEKNT